MEINKYTAGIIKSLSPGSESNLSDGDGAEAFEMAIVALRAQQGKLDSILANGPLTLKELQEMACKQEPVWCVDHDGINAGLLSMQDAYKKDEQILCIFLQDKEGHIGIYSVADLTKSRARFYRRRP